MAAEDAEMHDVEAEQEEAKEPETAKEPEADAPAGKVVLKAGQCCFLTDDTTLNVMPTVNGKLLMALSDGGFQYLLAGARASVGVKAGRYMFEVMIAEAKNMAEPQGARVAGPKPKQLVRIGLSTKDSSLILGTADGTDSVCFDSAGYFQHGKNREQVCKRFGHSQVAALVVNLDPSSPNANTVSLFVNGVRASPPQALPESLKGKVLYPTVTYRNVTLQVNFGPAPLRPLPFRCHTLQQVTVAHSQVTTAVAPKDGKYEVLMPVGLPDEGTFDWVDQFLAKNRNYTEISSRAILDWAAKSGLQRTGGYNRRMSNDQPEMNFGLALMDDLSVQRVMKAVAKCLPRNYVIAEVKGNLLPEMRAKSLIRFPSDSFKKVVQVMIGEPPAEYKAWVQQATLQEKTQKVQAEVMKKKAEAARKKAQEEQQKKREEERKKRVEDAKKAREARTKKEGGEDGEKAEGAEGDEAKPEEAKEEAAEDTKEEEVKEEEKNEVKEEPEEEVKVELTDEEKKLWFRKKEIPDLTSKDLSLAYPKFTLPTKEEGFDAVNYMWLKEPKCEEYLKKWVLERKMTQRIEDLQPSDWFKDKWGEWNRLVNSWKKKQQEFKDPARKRALQMAKQREEARRKAAEKKEAEAGKEVEEGKEAAEGEEAEKKETEEAPAEEEEAQAEEPEAMQVDVDSLDPFAVEDVKDIGNDGEPLFSKFVYEDWALLSLRFELHLLVHAFRHDVNDPDRQSFHENHLAFYYQKYFKKSLIVNHFGVKEVSELANMVKDTVEMTSSSSFDAQLSDDTPLDNFVKLTEDGRRERLERLDAGDENAALKFVRVGQEKGAPAGKGAPGKGAPYGGKDGGYGGKDGGYGGKDGGKGYTARAPPPASGKGGYYGGGGGGGAPPPSRGYEGGYAQQKRPFAPPAAASPYPPAQRARTGYGGGGGGAYGGGAPPAPSYGGAAPPRSYDRGGDRGSYGGGGGGGGGGYAGGSAYSRR